MTFDINYVNKNNEIEIFIELKIVNGKKILSERAVGSDPPFLSGPISYRVNCR